MIPVIDQYDVFKTMLLIILTFAAVFNGGLAWALYIIIEKRIEDKVIESADKTFIKSTAKTFTSIGYMCWGFFDVVELNREKKENYLRQAILFTNVAYQKYALKLDRKDRENDELICVIINNLAYYLAESCRLRIGVLERNIEENSRLALDYANEIRRKIIIHPTRTKEWLDTYERVQRYCAFD